jgi:DNA-directed RNA polymerase specialized sigma24 family protein
MANTRQLEETMSIEEIHERSFPGILRFATRVLGGDGAGNVAQEVPLRVARRLDRFRRDSPIRPRISRIARNTTLGRFRIARVCRSKNKGGDGS